MSTSEPMADACQVDEKPQGPLRRAFGAAKWYVASVMGDNHYERYVAVHRARHPGTPLLSKREYWKQRTDAQEKNPGTRCC